MGPGLDDERSDDGRLMRPVHRRTDLCRFGPVGHSHADSVRSLRPDRSVRIPTAQNVDLLRRRGLALGGLIIAWNAIVVVVAITAGIAAGSALWSPPSHWW